MIDLLGVSQVQRMEELRNLGVDLVSLHFGKDMQLEGELHTNLFSLVQDFSEFEVAVAGGIDLHSIPEILKKNPETIIVGSAITKATNCSEVALKMKGMINEYEVNH